MIEEYVTINSPSVTETEIRHSEFITYVFRVTSEEETFARLGEIRKKHSDATHVCYAAVFNAEGNATRFSDDGEPSRTAGQPIMEVIKKSGISEVLVVVVRYFGGIKLGAGGLTRAYSGCAADALKQSEKSRMRLCDFYSIQVDYAQVKRVQNVITRFSAALQSVDYSSLVTFNFACLSGRNINAELSDALGKTVDLPMSKRDYLCFPESENY